VSGSHVEETQYALHPALEEVLLDFELE